MINKIIIFFFSYFHVSGPGQSDGIPLYAPGVAAREEQEIGSAHQKTQDRSFGKSRSLTKPVVNLILENDDFNKFKELKEMWLKYHTSLEKKVATQLEINASN